jgi:hypothetical protein
LAVIRRQGDLLWSELLEERRQEVNRLESFDMRSRSEFSVPDYMVSTTHLDPSGLTSRNQEQDSVGQKPNSLHPLSSIKFVINQESSQVISTE